MAQLNATIKEQKQAAALERKEKITNIDNQRAKKKDNMSAMEKEQSQTDKQHIATSLKMMDENLDAAKMMNSLMLYSQCVTIRDKQLEEKGHLVKSKVDHEKKLDEMMEMERLKALRMYEERDKKRIEDRKKGALIIMEQIKEREQERMRQLELKEQESQAMLEHIEKMKHDDVSVQEKKKETTKRLMEDVAAANFEQIRLKKMQKLAELEEEKHIADYLKDKERREQEYVEEQKRIAAEKEREVARLRAMQEKARDKQAELDALRAKRAQEAHEREWRRKTKEEAEKKTHMNEDLHNARAKQKQEKEQQIAEQARIDREQFEKVVEHQKKDEELEKLKLEEKKKHVSQNSVLVQQQIENQKQNADKKKREHFEEGLHLKKKQDAEQKKIELIRQQKLSQMVDSAIPSKYIVDLKKKDFSKENLRPAKVNAGNAAKKK